MMLTFVLKNKWFDLIACRKKTHEYREVKPYWTIRIRNFEKRKEIETSLVKFQKGYKKEADCFLIKVKNISIINGKNTDLKIDKDVYDIELDIDSIAWI